MLDSIAGQFRRISRCKDNISFDLGVDDLTDLEWLEKIERFRGHTTVVFVNRTTRRYLGVA